MGSGASLVAYIIKMSPSTISLPTRWSHTLPFINCIIRHNCILVAMLPICDGDSIVRIPVQYKSFCSTHTQACTHTHICILIALPPSVMGTALFAFPVHYRLFCNAHTHTHLYSNSTMPHCMFSVAIHPPVWGRWSCSHSCSLWIYSTTNTPLMGTD